MSGNYVDLKIVDGAWNMDAGQQAELCDDVYSIAQDVKHSIMESGLARELVGERNAALRADVLVQIEQKAELDTRIIPGTATATELDAGEITLSAQVYEFGDVEVTL